MVRGFHLLLIVFLFFLQVLPASASYENINQNRIFKSKEKRYGHLKYFGYYASYMRPWNFTEELQGQANIMWVATWRKTKVDENNGVRLDILDTLKRVHQVKKAGMKAVVDLQPFVFTSEYSLDPDYLQNLIVFRDLLNYLKLMDTVVMLYPLDEPYTDDKKEKAGGVSAMYENLEVLTRDVKEIFPNKPIGVIYTHDTATSNKIQFNKKYDWVGYDCYKSLFNCDGKYAVDIYNKMLSKMKPHQKLMAVPQAFVYDDDKKENNLSKNLIKRLWHHYEIALSEPRFVAFVPFIYSIGGHNNSPGMSMDMFDEYFGEDGRAFQFLMWGLGMQIITANHNYPNRAYNQTEKDDNRDRDRYEAEIIDVSDNGLVSAWAYSRALRHKNLRVRIKFKEKNGDTLYTSPIERTFIKDTSIPTPIRDKVLSRMLLSDLSLGSMIGFTNLTIENFVGKLNVGTHGYRHKIPANIWSAHRDKNTVIEFCYYSDGEGMKNVGCKKREFNSNATPRGRHTYSRGTYGRR